MIRVLSHDHHFFFGVTPPAAVYLLSTRYVHRYLPSKPSGFPYALALSYPDSHKPHPDHPPPSPTETSKAHSHPNYTTSPLTHSHTHARQYLPTPLPTRTCTQTHHTSALQTPPENIPGNQYSSPFKEKKIQQSTQTTVNEPQQPATRRLGGMTNISSSVRREDGWVDGRLRGHARCVVQWPSRKVLFGWGGTDIVRPDG
ncbi:hypothetical protein L873DRAFT_499424 [Choiromyces venosus 120613-1]|uniref:Uncharacterized protein n=1 Tax=Choiromyces venosus 120613-1 TaxID=1336337 RepID=A0A3N4J8H7_9PEZI|nr:hypothetical protein L873DRAFT_499424 [Choiromyces venosus 120613-1]